MKKPHKAKPKHKRRGNPACVSAHAQAMPRRAPAPSFAVHFERLAELVPAWPAPLASGRAIADVYGADEREALALLLLPFFLLAFAIGISQSIRPGHRASDYVTVPFEAAETGHHKVRLPAAERGQLAEPVRVEVAASRNLARIGAAELQPSTQAAAVASGPAATVVETPGAAIGPARPDTSPMPALTLSPAPVAVAAARITLNGAGAVPAPAASSANAPPSALAAGRPPLERLAALEPPPARALPDALLPAAGPPLGPDLTIVARPEMGPRGPNICAISDIPVPATAAVDGVALARDPAAFGLRLAAVARDQLDDLVIYNDAYRRISYPLGDVPAMFGVCTDVVIRAYRALGVDLQALVHLARTGSGDTNIDHRRVETLRRFFATRGTSLPVTDFPEDYRAGDIVTYYRPQNRHSRSHIAIVSDVTGPSGRPMIVHNRGWGVQLEDGLFVDQITGHYRFAAAPTPIAPTRTASPGTARRATAASPARSAAARSGVKPARVTLCPVATRGGPSGRRCVSSGQTRVGQAGPTAHSRTQ